MGIWGIAYTSRALGNITPHLLERLLVQARWFNEQAGVTGVLLHSGDTFFQYFEGPRASVERVYARIRGSDLHAGLVEIFSQAVPQRSFSHWHMACAQAPQTLVQELCNEQWDIASSSLDRRAIPLGLNLLMRFWDSVQDKVPLPVGNA